MSRSLVVGVDVAAAAYIACAVGRTRISLSDTLRGRETANAMTSAMSSGRIAVEATNSSVPLRVSSWVMWLTSSVATAPGSTTRTRADVGLKLLAQRLRPAV